MFPHVFEAGTLMLEHDLELRVREFPTTRMSPMDLRRSPQARAGDLNAAFADPSIKAIAASIGGNDSARILPFLDETVIRSNPNILLGYSDTATQLLACHQLGLVTFNGPAVMAGFAQLRHFPAAAAHVRAVLFEPTETYAYEPFPEWVDSYHDWTEATDADGASRVGERRDHDGWHWLNGTDVARGRLVGGCVEVLEFLKGSRWWPEPGFWDERILFLETSEDRPTVEQVQYWLFNYGVQGVFDRLNGLIVGRARGYSDEDKARLDEMIIDVAVEEFGATHLTIVTNMDFGHTDPQWILPLGVRAELDPIARTFRLLEAAVT